jgi:hypothetical protein
MTARARHSRATAYDGAHVAARAAYVARFRPGQPCAIGGEPLWRHTLRKWCDLLDLAHDHKRGGYLGLACRRHNRGEGAARGNRMRGLRRRLPAPARSGYPASYRRW